MNTPEIRPMTAQDCEGFRAALDVVAREERCLGSAEAPPPEEVRRFVLARIEACEPGIVADLPCTGIVGWCDIGRIDAASRRHCGRLGMGVLPDWRGQGLGRRLLDAALAAADALPMDRVELDVLADNAAAIALYERAGFRREGLRPGAWRLGGRTRDLVLMGRARPDAGQKSGRPS